MNELDPQPLNFEMLAYDTGYTRDDDADRLAALIVAETALDYYGEVYDD